MFWWSDIISGGLGSLSFVNAEHAGYTSAGYLLSKQQLLVELTVCGLYTGAGNTPENTVGK